MLSHACVYIYICTCTESYTPNDPDIHGDCIPYPRYSAEKKLWHNTQCTFVCTRAHLFSIIWLYSIQ